MTSRPKLRRIRAVVFASMCACVLALSLLWPGAALAQEEDIKHDARLDGYQPAVHIENDSTALTWLLLVFLSMVAMGVMFKSSKRTHLD